ncbi:MAG TPA: hypothetical protein VHW01_14195 [Polyangiaceae bacterium]|jgi:hypothetical protein|nr:hypothetical protein [Polyangiaceae bacterium]
MKSARAWVIAASLVVGGCSTAPSTGSDGTADEVFSLAKNDGTTLDATLSAGGASLHLLSIESAPKIVDITYDFGEPVIAFRIDYNLGEADFMPSGAALDNAHNRLLDSMLDHVGALLDQDETKRPLALEVAYRQTSFMQIVPVGEPLSAFHFVSERGWVSISCSCGNQYIGDGYYRTAGRGCGCTGGSGNGCKGRCGQGCGGTSTPKCVGSTAYTQDCGRHDYGLAAFSTASDDYAFAPNNCSCVGGCY